VRDLAPLLAVMAGYDAGDIRSVRRPARAYLNRSEFRGIRIGMPTNDYFTEVDPEISRAMSEAVKVMTDLGMDIRALALPDPQPMIDATLTMVRAESAAAHRRRLDDNVDALQPMLRARLEQGSKIAAVTYLDAMNVWSTYRKQFVRDVFADMDALIAPSVPEPPPPLHQVERSTDETMSRLAHFGRYMRFFNGLGVPVLAVPCGFTSQGVPLGLQIAGRPFEEDKLLAIGSAYEEVAQWFTREPRLADSA
jgi:aspartyl-tRNA(Asn)/glutamyl-tRNA(Gln) amidotransferase subunit A